MPKNRKLPHQLNETFFQADRPRGKFLAEGKIEIYFRVKARLFLKIIKSLKITKSSSINLAKLQVLSNKVA